MNKFNKFLLSTIVVGFLSLVIFAVRQKLNYPNVLGLSNEIWCLISGAPIVLSFAIALMFSSDGCEEIEWGEIEKTLPANQRS